MTHYLRVLLLGLASAACSSPSPNGRDCGGPPSVWTTLDLVAGGLGGNGNVDDIGTAARFGNPSGVVVDDAGNLYVADTAHATLRKVVLATGTVTTVAGVADWRGIADGTGAGARFHTPYGMALDGAGTLYVADRFSATIRKVVLATGLVTTLAGNPAIRGKADGTGSAARFAGPSGVAVDNAGNLFISDHDNNTIRKVELATGVVTTLAGSTAGIPGSADGSGSAARFDGPDGVAVDGLGNLYVADTFSHSIRKVVLATGVVTTLAGTAGLKGSADGTGPAARFDGPSGVTMDRTGNLLIADANNHTIRKVVPTSGEVTTLTGTAGMPGSADGTGAAARFYEPHGVAVDGTGNLYLADTANNVIRRVVLATGAATTVAGTAGMQGSADGTGAAARFDDPSGVAVEGEGSVYVADTENFIIRKVVLATGVVTTLAGTAGMQGSTDGTGAAARFSQPTGVAADRAGNLYVADTKNSTIRKIVLATGVVSTLAGYTGITGGTDGIGAAVRFSFPRGLAADDGGNLYVADYGNSTIRKIELATGAVSTLAGGPKGSADGVGTAARFNLPRAVAVDCSGNLYVADTGNSTIRKLVLATGVVTTLAGAAGMVDSVDGPGTTARFFAPDGIAVDGVGNLYVAEKENNSIRRIALADAAVTTLIGKPGQIGVKLGPLPARLNMPAAVAVSPRGELVIVDENAVLAVR